MTLNKCKELARSSPLRDCSAVLLASERWPIWMELKALAAHCQHRLRVQKEMLEAAQHEVDECIRMVASRRGSPTPAAPAELYQQDPDMPLDLVSLARQRVELDWTNYCKAPTPNPTFKTVAGYVRDWLVHGKTG